MTSPPVVTYCVTVLPERHELAVELTIEGLVAQDSLSLEVPTWVPGDYGFMQFGRDLFDLQAHDKRTGTSLPVTRQGWQSFHVEHVHDAVRISYRAYAYATEFAEACGIVDGEYAIILGTRYVRVRECLGPYRVTYSLPLGWKIHHPSGAVKASEDSTWDYPSYEALLDSPVVMGRFDLIQRKVRGTDFYFAFVDRAIGYESQVQSFVDGLAKVAEEYHEIFGAFPFADYTFLLTLNPLADWGLEHLSSSTCGLGPDLFIDSSQTAFGTRVCAHELFHAWNVRRLRPAPLKQLDLQKGSFTEGLWMAEGFTRYYEFLVCTRAGMYAPEQFFSSVVNYYRHLIVAPAYKRVSAVDSSLGTYLNHGKYPGRCNDSIDYYDKGMVIAFDLDAHLRMTIPADSLDEAFRSFYEKYVGSKLGYTTADVLGFFEERSSGLGEMLSAEATHVSALSLETQLERLGFHIGTEIVRYVGLMFNSPGGPNIYNVLDESPAGDSGIAPEDIIDRVNGFPFSMKALAWAARRCDPMTLEVLRGHRMLTFKLFPAERREIATLSWMGTEMQARLIRTWLHREDFRPPSAYQFSLDFYENFHGVESVV